MTKTMPKIPKITFLSCKFPRDTSVASLSAIRPICFNPTKLINVPIPALIARRKSSGMDLITQILKFVKDSATKITPDKKTTPSAVCQGTFMPKTNPKVKYAFNPIPTLIATGVFAQSPFKTVESIVIIAVAVISASKGIPALLIMLAFTGTI